MASSKSSIFALSKFRNLERKSQVNAALQRSTQTLLSSALTALNAKTKLDYIMGDEIIMQDRNHGVQRNDCDKDNLQDDAKGALRYAAPASKANDYITLRAEMDTIIAFSACPNDKLEVSSPIEICSSLGSHARLFELRATPKEIEPQMHKISMQVNGTIGPDGKFKAEIQDCHYEILD